ncbi:hypothetical protein EJ06DRAFT_551429 [Trichodelitschia bisporula]|uniref:Autophagy-related protein 13 n=1 Tax=Trichodelitschia bisporula TaxID=703511 RepID=A0A6G1HM75_9PEZI|nr:hypothetical protein EJ06DRAFT_551429 [Trichodelitschia bisporula]
MYQPPRPSRPPTASSPRPSINPNPQHRTNHDRDDSLEQRRSSYDTPARGTGGPESTGDLAAEPTVDNSELQARETQKLNQIVQQFFTKGALTIVSARTVLPQAFTRAGTLRQNKWFNVILDDSDELISHVVDWRTAKLEDSRPPPLILEIYLDLTELTRSQSLVVIDDAGKRWDVAEALNPPVAGTRPPSRLGRTTHVTLERWEIRLDDHTGDYTPQHDSLSNVYKRGIPLFRSLYTWTRLLPAWKFYRRISKQPANHPALKPMYRVLNGQFKSPRKDTLDVPLCRGEEGVTDSYAFDALQCPAGQLNISVTYRKNCDFRVDDSESLLSSHFMGMDDHYFRPSLVPTPQPGSAPTARKEPADVDRGGQVYGSMSTFHNLGPAPSSSPISALRAARDIGSLSPSDTPPQKQRPSPAPLVKPSLRPEGPPPNPRRASVSFQPFKAGSLASSPATSNLSPSGSVPRSLTQPRTRNSLTNNTLPQMALRTPTMPNDMAIASSGSSSPKPAPIARFSSSFSHRRSRFSSGGGSKGEDDNNSSGKASASSSAHPGSDVLGGEQGSYGSAPQTDDDNLKDFIRLLEAKKDLKSFAQPSQSTRESSMRRTTAALGKFQRMRDSNLALEDEISSFLLPPRSSGASSRQLQAVPAMLPPSACEASSPGGKPVSPHTPAVPSRLSAGSVVEYGPDPAPRVSRSRARQAHRMADGGADDDTAGERPEEADEGAFSGAIDIPTSPRPWAFGRNAAEEAQEEGGDSFGLRSTSLPNDGEGEGEGEGDLSLSELLRVAEEGERRERPSGPLKEGRSLTWGEWEEEY